MHLAHDNWQFSPVKEGKASEQSQSGKGLLITGSSLQLYLGLGKKNGEGIRDQEG